MARKQKMVYMEHEDHGVLPVYDSVTIAENKANGWKECTSPHGSPAMRKLWKQQTADDLAEAAPKPNSNALA